MKKICIFTGTRAEYGLLKPIISKVQSDKSVTLQLVVSGMHLSPEFGFTYKEIELDGFQISERVEMLLSSDTTTGTIKSMGIGMIGLADAFERLSPDILILLGDRFECFAAATAATVSGIPIAHIHGGELTAGIIDEAFRHSISKMSFLHFTSTEEYRKRVIQLGEEPERVFNVGALGVESAINLPLLGVHELERELDFGLSGDIALVTFHPVTLEKGTAAQQFANLLMALDSYPDMKVIFTKANSDAEGRIINKMVDDYSTAYSERCIAFYSLGQLRYLSLLQYCSMVIGNSSSGIIEVPSFHKPTVNLGERQAGRIRANSVIDCDYSVYEIKQAIDKALSLDNALDDVRNPYEGNATSQLIFDKVLDFVMREKKQNILMKQFYDLEWS